MITTGLAGLGPGAASWAALPVGLLEVCWMARSEAFRAASGAELWAASRVKSLGESQAAFESSFSVPPAVGQALAGRGKTFARCHSERSEESRSASKTNQSEIPRCARNDMGTSFSATASARPWR